MQAFTDLVGTSAVPAHCFDSTELTDLTPALDPANDTAIEWGGAGVTYTLGFCN